MFDCISVHIVQYAFHHLLRGLESIMPLYVVKGLRVLYSMHSMPRAIWVQMEAIPRISGETG
jgi:hypothetical protein